MCFLRFNDIIYNNKRLSDFGFIVTRIGSVNENNNSLGVSREIIGSELNVIRDKRNIFGVKYVEPLKLPLFIIKNPCENNSQTSSKITLDELRSLLSWLTSPKSSKKMILETDEYSYREYYGLFTTIEPYDIDELYGITVTFECLNPYGFELFHNKYKCENEKEIILNLNSDEEYKYVYPIIDIELNNTDEFSITNTSDNNKTMSFKFNKQYNKIQINCENQRIIADGELLSLYDVCNSINELTDYNNVGTGIFDMYWLRLLPFNNRLKINGNCICNITYRVPVKAGGYY